ncbi:hypothetical protein [uncultured Microbacterium sp.]|uniref:hypothetical protein n=1 Tax=uncultured Microbacterium sp. TaxID=191216 RepID=UPI0028D834A3|nr:hypothetical protein [uncultured Microbacterium sp.]
MSGDVLATPVARRRKALWISLAVAAVVALGAITAYGVAASGGGGSAPDAGSGGGAGSDTSASTSPTPAPSPTVTATPAPAAPPTVDGELDDDAALVTVETALAAPISTVGTSEDLAVLLKDVAVDAYAAEIEAQWQELVSQGWTITGEPTLVSSDVTAVDAEADPATAEITACIDSSAVAILDANGDRIGDESATMPRALHLFTLVQGDDDIWRIASHSFPNDPTC